VNDLTDEEHPALTRENLFGMLADEQKLKDPADANSDTSQP